MSIHEEYFDDAKKAIRYLENFLNGRDEYIFRGHNKVEYRLQSSMFRYQKMFFDLVSGDIDMILKKFQVGLAKIGKYPQEHYYRQDWLEYARHYGVPSPCIDFTYSPYIALFFAFNGIEIPKSVKDLSYIIVYALNITELANGWTKFKCKPMLKDNWSDEIYQDFFYPKNQYFKDGFPSDTLLFIPFPSRKNQRMIRQMGALLYDTLDYEKIAANDLEEFIDQIKEVLTTSPSGPIPGSPTLTKVYIDKKCISDVLEKLELMGISGGYLFLNEEGVAMDVVNSKHYVSRHSYLRDINIPRK